ncbi:hypothetical protein ABTX61_18385 [Amycolatopsis japonica]|uniref:hypothetical protein n=1 Tax=Amycolatopsis japonica TaxID=208439 RepID=UPI0033296661
MPAIELQHLTFIGGPSPASIEFSPRLTVIYGASDTGKSFVVEAIDFALGAGKRLRDIPEVRPYSHVLLGVKLPNDSLVTFSRPVTGGRIGVYNGDRRELPSEPPSRVISPQHSPKSATNISRYLLRELDLDEFFVRTNKQNKTRMLSLRDLSHLSIIDETKMQALRSPVMPTGQYTSETVEKSIFSALLRGEDDSRVQHTPVSSEKKRINKGKIEVLERARAEFAKEDALKDSTSELRDRLDRIVSATDRQAEATSEYLRAKDELVTARTALLKKSEGRESRLSEIDVMIARFDLLLRQYDSDLARLEMVSEAGSILGFFEPGVCVFCGAEPEHQNLLNHVTDETNSLGLSVQAEAEKTRLLRNDLMSTIGDLREQRSELLGQLSIDNESRSNLDLEIERLDQRLKPIQEELVELISHRSTIERVLGVRDKISTIDAILVDVTDEGTGTPKLAEVFNPQALREFTSSMRSVLSAWGVPESDSVNFDVESVDIAVGGRLRGTRGKGMRAILHAGFTVSFAQYCFDRDLPHLGFVVLDSPVVTYRAPDNSPAPAEDEYMTRNVVEGFYSYLQNSFDGQSVVVENVDPPSAFDDESSAIYFTGSRANGRYGLFPIEE